MIFGRLATWGTLTLTALAVAGCAADELEPLAAPSAASAASPSASPSASPTASTTPGPTRVGPPDLGPVAAGERPPQVVVISFDGAGVAVGGRYPMFQYWRDVSRSANARFTYFLSGPYLLTHANIDRYTAPQLGTATQAMPFEVSGVLPLPGQSETDAIRYELGQLRDAHAEGSEIGTHFNGHICGDEPGSVARFSAADWEQELDEFDDMVDHANENNAITPRVELGFTSTDIVGSRTPCLEGDFAALYPELERRGFRYESSPTPDSRAPTTWPLRGAYDTGKTSLWVFPLAFINQHNGKGRTLSMDYNLCFGNDTCRTKAAYPVQVTDRWSTQALDTYRQYFEANYTGNRAPVFLGNHFEMWHNGAYTEALASFAVETCNKPEVRCVSNRDLAEWLTATPADQLDSWRAGDFPRYLDAPAPTYGEPVPGAPKPQAVETTG